MHVIIILLEYLKEKRKVNYDFDYLYRNINHSMKQYVIEKKEVVKLKRTLSIGLELQSSIWSIIC
jgi:hypothetical protein